MVFRFSELFEKYQVQEKGVLHIGASTGQEIEAYYELGIERIIWVEAIPEVFAQLKQNVARYPNALVLNACISDFDGKEVDFNVASNSGESSSFLPLGTHKVAHPSVTYVRSFKTITRRIDTLLRDNGIDIRDYAFLNIDLQGAELFALRGMGDLLYQINCAYLEVNSEELYVGCALIGEIDEYLMHHGLFRVQTYWAGNTGWGDAFYVRA